MKYVKSGAFTNEQFSTLETLDEISDVVTIAQDCIEKGDVKLAQTNLKQADKYIETVCRKVKIALKYVPESVQEKEFL
jgi:23S rRNA C2498 (ribose-2'-O)-methylase RlmM